MPENAGLIKYQDLSFKSDLPAAKAGFSLSGESPRQIYPGRKPKENPADWGVSVRT